MHPLQREGSSAVSVVPAGLGSLRGPFPDPFGWDIWTVSQLLHLCLVSAGSPSVTGQRWGVVSPSAGCVLVFSVIL